MNWFYLTLIALGLFLIFETVKHHLLRKTLRFFIFLFFLILSIYIISSYLPSSSSSGISQTGAAIFEFIRKGVN